MEKLTKFETLLKKNDGLVIKKRREENTNQNEENANTKWYPHLVDDIKAALILDESIEKAATLRSNLAYSIQYIEYLELLFSELSLSDPLTVMHQKTYIITGMSILEGIFSNILKSNDLWSKSDIELISVTDEKGKNRNYEFRSNSTKIIINDTLCDCVVKTELYKKVTPYYKQMNLKDMIDVLSKHHKALNVNHFVYPALKRLKNFRNRIHLQSIEYERDHDYNAFDYRVKKEMGSILYNILTSEMVSNNPKIFDFLKVNLDEK